MQPKSQRQKAAFFFNSSNLRPASKQIPHNNTESQDNKPSQQQETPQKEKKRKTKNTETRKHFGLQYKHYKQRAAKQQQ